MHHSNSFSACVMLEVLELLELAELLKCMIVEIFPEVPDAFGRDTTAEALCMGVSCDALEAGSEGLPKRPLSSRCSSGQWPSVAKHPSTVSSRCKTATHLLSQVSKFMAKGTPASQKSLKAVKTASKAQSQMMIQVSLPAVGEFWA